MNASRFNTISRALFFGVALQIGVIGCTSKSSTAVQKSTDTPSQDVSSDVYTGNSQISANLNSNLFDTSTSADVVAASVTPTPSASPYPVAPIAPPSQQNSLCLNGGWNTSSQSASSVNNPYQSGTSFSPACFNADISGGLGGLLNPPSPYDLGLDSFSAMQSCYTYVASAGAQMCPVSGTTTTTSTSSQISPEQAFQMSQMALVRCFRQVLRQQMAVAQWAPEQTVSYQNTDSNLYYLLLLLSMQQQ